MDGSTSGMERTGCRRRISASRCSAKSGGCELSEAITNGTQEMKDQWLCDCLLCDCPVATMYAALSGFGHVRDRLKKYEDAGMMPPEVQKHE